MGIDDRIQNKSEDFGGRAKEAAGAVSGNEELKAEGRSDQAKAGFKDKVEDVKDAAREGLDNLKRKID
ncbi:CsbD family protein [Pseudoclavibacter sp. AY1F1]|uniref:CsbD family protein n=1 Tax=Pseudoclavibacter sp. AY1F1 TaxID=2080583 RepID=UPI000CE7281B|nr:CsbD family protein [Pseudoclavibacter sp. AY1F1]PPF46758.1 CsbD family protein [Pseudoclavibacter sp. AY1F1]